MKAAAAHEAVRAEQLRLVLAGVVQSVVIGFLVSTLMVAALWLLVPHVVLLCWYGTFLVERLASAIFARRSLRIPREAGRDRSTERILLLNKFCEGAILGSLLWIGLPAEAPPVSILLMSLMGAACSNAASLLAPRRHLYLAFVIPLVTFAVVILWTMGGPPYRILAAFCILYVTGQYGQVRLANDRIRESIELRFENSLLIDQLRGETDLARLARQDAEHANAAKSQVLAAASHDLRQPVHALGLFLQALSQTKLNDAQQKFVRQAQAASIASADMLNTLLDFSRLEAGVVAPSLTAFSLQPLLDKLENELAPLADAKSLIYRSPATDAVVCSDAALLELVLRNLILNAIRYTDRGGLLIACRRRGAALSIEVYDTGIGIPADQRESIFREFHQLGNPERDRRNGLGLGLAIVRGLAASLGHELSLASQQGRGSAFRILVPIASPEEVETAPHAAIEASEGGLNADILIVEDDPIVREAMVQLLSSWGCRCWAVEMPGEALELPCIAGPDAIVCDHRLRENVKGTEAVALLRRHWRRPIPAILITGDTAPERMREALDSGLPLLHKPVAPDKLYNHLAMLIPPERSAQRAAGCSDH